MKILDLISLENFVIRGNVDTKGFVRVSILNKDVFISSHEKFSPSRSLLLCYVNNTRILQRVKCLTRGGCPWMTSYGVGFFISLCCRYFLISTTEFTASDHKNKGRLWNISCVIVIILLLNRFESLWEPCKYTGENSRTIHSASNYSRSPPWRYSSPLSKQK